MEQNYQAILANLERTAKRQKEAHEHTIAHIAMIKRLIEQEAKREEQTQLPLPQTPRGRGR